MAFDEMITSGAFPVSRAETERVGQFLRAVYGWMGAGLAMTAITAWLVASSPALLMAVATSRMLFWTLTIAELGLVFYLSARVDRLSPVKASLLFVLYSALTGVTISFVLLAYTGQSVASTFFVAAAMFGGLAFYGTVTRRSLQGLGQFLFMGLLGVVVAELVGVFWHSDGFQFVVSFIGVIVFAGLAAYEAQRLKAMALASSSGLTENYAIVGALALYLDFINLFLFLLQFMGTRRD